MLTVREHQALTIAGRRYAHPGRRVTDMLEQAGYTEPTFWHIVDGLLDRGDALAEMPAEVGRLRRLREARAAARRACARGTQSPAEQSLSRPA